VLGLKCKVIIGMDLAGKPETPTGLALLKGKTVQASLVNMGDELLKSIIFDKLALTAIDAPSNIPKEGIHRKTERGAGERIVPSAAGCQRCENSRSGLRSW
jgi:predicted nuclease with RNAse H fold